MNRLLALLLAALLLTGCAAQQPPTSNNTAQPTASGEAQPAAAPQALTAALTALPQSLDPALCATDEAATLCAHLFSGLARWSVDAHGASVIVPDLAESLPDGVQNADGTVTYTYTLRAGACWSDGMPVTAQDFVTGWQRAAAMQTDAPSGYLLAAIDGYTEGDPAAQLNVQAPDARTLVVTLRAQTPAWEQLLALPVFSPVRADTAERDDWADSAAHFVGSGRYLLQSWTDDAITLQKNPCHPDAQNTTLQTLTFCAADAGTMLQTFRDGDWLFTDDVPAEALSDLVDDPAFYSVGRCATYYVCWNVSTPLLPDAAALDETQRERAQQDIRRALLRLIDRSALTALTGGGQQPAASLVALGVTEPDGSQFCANAGAYRGGGYYDVTPAAASTNCALALQTLKKYYNFDAETGKFTNFPTLQYLYNTSAGHAQVAEFLRASFAGIGIPLELTDLDSADFLQTRSRGAFDLARGGWAADYDDAACFLDLWTTDAGANTAGLGLGDHARAALYSIDLRDLGYDDCVTDGTWSETYDVLLARAETCTDAATRTQLLHRAEDLLMQTGCVMPLYYYTDLYLLSPRVSGFYTNPLGTKYFDRCTIN